MREKVYLETTVASYYSSRPSNDIIILARQRITQLWWERAIGRYSIFISEAVVEEAADGDLLASQKRLQAIKPFPLLDINEDVAALYKIYIKRLAVPQRALRDAVHLAVASVHCMDYLVTWNCAHIANGEIIKKVMEINIDLGVSIPVILTPEELLEV
jgi:predicted nucleic acid-binding protein